MNTQKWFSIRTFIAVMFSALLATALVGCEKEGPAEKAGKQIDEATTDIGNSMEDACEDVKDAAGAKDTDC